jgi:hypothetical protein
MSILLHASLELAEAIVGTAPGYPVGVSPMCGRRWACEVVWAFRVAQDESGFHCVEDPREVDCIDCQVALDAAREGVVLTGRPASFSHPKARGGK